MEAIRDNLGIRHVTVSFYVTPEAERTTQNISWFSTKKSYYTIKIYLGNRLEQLLHKCFLTRHKIFKRVKEYQIIL